MNQTNKFVEQVGMTTYTVTVNTAENAKEKPEELFENLILNNWQTYLNAEDAGEAKQ